VKFLKIHGATKLAVLGSQVQLCLFYDLSHVMSGHATSVSFHAASVHACLQDQGTVEFCRKNTAQPADVSCRSSVPAGCPR
jgi:hypothetical protein